METKHDTSKLVNDIIIKTNLPNIKVQKSSKPLFDEQKIEIINEVAGDMQTLGGLLGNINSFE